MATSELQQQPTPPIRSNLFLVKDMRPMLKNAECEVIVLQQEGEPTNTRDGDMIYHFLVADKTASILLNVWGIPGQYVKGGDILHIIGGSCRIRKGVLCLTAFHSSKVRRIGQDTFPFVEKPNLSEIDYNQPANNPSNNPNWGNNNTSGNNGKEQDQQQQQKNTTRSHNRGYPYRGGRPPREGRGQNKGRYHRDLDNVM